MGVYSDNDHLVTRQCLLQTPCKVKGHGKARQIDFNLFWLFRCMFIWIDFHSHSCCLRTWRLVLWSEKGELKKVVTMLMTVSVTYRSRIVSACLRSLVLLHTCNHERKISRISLSLDSYLKDKVNADDPYSANINQEILKEFPHVVGSVDLLHLHLCVHVAMVQEVDVGDFHLKRLGIWWMKRLCSRMNE